ncbi:MAG: GNAT family N-acetyltransferase [Reinekea sp.]|nr:GNAT family N-acetyltransferase [Reinekea sp.]
MPQCGKINDFREGREPNMFNIRSANISDLPYLYEICLKTGNRGGDASDFFNDPYLIGQYFVAPYLFFELDLCFVAELDGIPIGYIVGTSDTAKYNEWLSSQWLPHLRLKYPRRPTKTDLDSFLLDVVHNEPDLPSHCGEFPAHLHIDLLPIAQGQGLGQQLMTRFLNSLREKATKGVYLGVDDLNKKAVKFYQKYGYQLISQQPGVIYLGLALPPA